MSQHMADIKGDPNRFILNTSNGQVMQWNPARHKNMAFRPDWVECDAEGTPLKTKNVESTIGRLERELAEAKKRLAAYETLSDGPQEAKDEEPALVEVEDLVTVEEVSDRRENILNAIAQIIEGGDPDALTASGAPHVKMIEAVTGFDITAAERDTVWADYQSQK